MSLKKRSNDENTSSVHKSKKIKLDKESPAKPSTSTPKVTRTEEIDFPRGGGTSLSAVEYKALRQEAEKELDEELFKDDSAPKPHIPRPSKSSKKAGASSKKDQKAVDAEPTVPQPHRLFYKNLTSGSKTLCRIVSVKPIALVVALPGPIVGHIPITNISPLYSQRIEKAGEDDGSDDAMDDEDVPPELSDMYRVGEYVRAVVVQVHPTGTKSELGSVPATDEERMCGRVELTLAPNQINEGLNKSDLIAGLTISAAVKSIEDHGYALDFGIDEVSGFLKFSEAKKGSTPSDEQLPIGIVIQCSVISLSSNGRICKVTLDSNALWRTAISEASSLSSVLPGSLVSGLITDESASGFHLQVLGLFQGSVNSWHVPRSTAYKVGQRVQARVLYDIRDTNPPQFSLSFLPHLLTMTAPTFDSDQNIQDAFPKGTRLDNVKVLQVQKRFGLTCQVAEGVLGFVSAHSMGDDSDQISELSGPWKVGSVHPARVLGFSALDGVLILTMQTDLIEEQYLTAADVEVGQVLKVTVKSLSPNHMLVGLSSKLKGIVFPIHYSDILLKHPERKYQEGKVVKARVYHVDPEKGQIRLTLKKTLVQSELPTYSKFEDAKVGDVVHGTIFKILPNAVLVEYFGDTRGYVASDELSDEPVVSTSTSFNVGQVVKTRITKVDVGDHKIFASIRQALPSFVPPNDINSIEIGDKVEGTIIAIKEKSAQIKLQTSGVRATVSLAHLAKKRDTTVDALQQTLKVGDTVEDLLVRFKDVSKGLAICAFEIPKSEKKKSKADDSDDEDMEQPKKLKVGQVVEAEVISRDRLQSTLRVKDTGLEGHLMPTDTCDDYSAEGAVLFPEIGSTVKAIVVNKVKSRIDFSTRRSRVDPKSKPHIIDPEILMAKDVKVGQVVRGFVSKNDSDTCRVVIGRTLPAMVSKYESPTEDLKVGELVQGTIIKIAGHKVTMSLRSPEEIEKMKASQMTVKDLTIGEEVDTLVQRIESYGVFLRIVRTNILGLCHKREITNNKAADVDEALEGFKPGDPLRAFVLKVDAARRQVDFTLRASRFGGKKDALAADDSMAVDEDESEAGEAEAGDDHEDLSESGSKGDEDDELRVEEADKAEAPPSSTDYGTASSSSALKLQGGFNWSGDAPTNDDDVEMNSDSESSEPEAGPSTLSKKSKTPRSAIQHDRTTDMHNKAPESSADYERLLKVTPDSSFLWVQFMAFQLQLSEIDKAREIGRRALQVINFREEQEKLNVWIALLNLEIAYGTDESSQAIFADASRANDAKTIHLRFAALLDEAGKHEQAEEMYQRTVKKFGTSSKAWTLFGEYYLRNGKVEEARALLPRSLKSLERRKHLKVISKFAQMEYRHGDPERGKTIFEGIVDSHPKRLDLWAVYIDQEAKQGNLDAARLLFNRILSQKLSSKKAKFIFKKWLEVEKKIGPEQGVEAVKTRAIEWTQLNGIGGDM